MQVWAKRLPPALPRGEKFGLLGQRQAIFVLNSDLVANYSVAISQGMKPSN